MLSLFDHLYGAWFLPQRTFLHLRQQPPLWQAAVVMVVIQCIDAGRRSDLNVATLLLAVTTGMVGWMIVASILRLVAFCLGRDPDLSMILVLLAFGSLPWVFTAPAQAFGGAVGALLSAVVLIWFIVWQIWVVAIAMDLPWWRLVWLVPLTGVAGVLALSWATTTLSTLASFGG